MSCLSDLIQELESFGGPKDRINDIAAELLATGANAAVERPETLVHAMRRYRRMVEAYLSQQTWARQ
jgi:hypothetical protein